MWQIDQQTGVDHQVYTLTVFGDAGLVAQRVILRLPAGSQLDALGVGGLDVRRWAQMYFASRAIDDDGVAGIEKSRDIVYFADRGDAEGTRDDGDVRRRPAFLEDQA